MVSGKKILLVEDSPSVSAFFQNLLEAEGYHVITAADGVEAISRFYSAVPDLVVSDVEMPIMNGYHVCRLIKSEPVSSKVPFILLTSLSEARYKYWGLEVGADRYVLKDEGQTELLPAVKELLVASQSSATDIAQLSNKYADTSRILGRLNRILDDKLFRMTLTGTITSLAFQDTPLNGIVHQLLGTLLQIIHAQSLTLSVVSPEEILFFVHAETPQTANYIESASQYCMDYISRKSSLTTKDSAVSVDYFCDVAATGVDFDAVATTSFFRRLSDDVHVCLQLSPLPHDQVPKETLELVESLMDYISVTVGHSFMQHKVKNLSVIDSLTRLYNRGHFMALLTAEYKRTIRHNLELSMVFLDIDNFKRINDTHGHLVGDLVLRVLSETIMETIRTSDVAGRYGGEEFVIYFPETSTDNAAKTAERLRRNTETRRIPIGSSEFLHFTISVGVAAVSQMNAGEEIENLLEIADQKLYYAKQTGKNRVIV